jgi:beta-lactam-binding protein with PASTA domain
MNDASRWLPGWLTIGIAGAAGFLMGVVVLVVARGVVHDEVRTVTRTVQVQVQPRVPDVTGASVEEAQSALRRAGYETEVHGGGFFGPSGRDTVVEQDPRAGAALPGGATVEVRVD